MMWLGLIILDTCYMCNSDWNQKMASLHSSMLHTRGYSSIYWNQETIILSESSNTNSPTLLAPDKFRRKLIKELWATIFIPYLVTLMIPVRKILWSNLTWKRKCCHAKQSVFLSIYWN